MVTGQQLSRDISAVSGQVFDELRRTQLLTQTEQLRSIRDKDTSEGDSAHHTKVKLENHRQISDTSWIELHLY